MKKIPTLKTARLNVSPMRDDEIQEMIATQKVPELKQAFSEMLDGRRTDPEHRIWFVLWKRRRSQKSRCNLSPLSSSGYFQ